MEKGMESFFTKRNIAQKYEWAQESKEENLIKPIFSVQILVKNRNNVLFTTNKTYQLQHTISA